MYVYMLAGPGRNGSIISSGLPVPYLGQTSNRWRRWARASGGKCFLSARRRDRSRVERRLTQAWWLPLAARTRWALCGRQGMPGTSHFIEYFKSIFREAWPKASVNVEQPVMVFIKQLWRFTGRLCLVITFSDTICHPLRPFCLSLFCLLEVLSRVPKSDRTQPVRINLRLAVVHCYEYQSSPKKKHFEYK